MLRNLKKAEYQHIMDMVAAALFALGPAGLVSASFTLADDWSGQSAINFLCTLEDVFFVGGKFPGDVMRHIEESIRRIVEPEEYSLLAYFNWRSEKEWRAAVEKLDNKEKEAECSHK